METIEEERRRTIEDIPNEILLKIFYYLSFNDNIAAGDVCKRYMLLGSDYKYYISRACVRNLDLRVQSVL